MFRRMGTAGLLALAVASLGGCDDGAGPDAPLTADESDELAAQMADETFVALAGATDDAGSSFTAPEYLIERSVTITRSCPLDGEVVIQHDATIEHDPETRHSVADITGSITHDECGRTVRGREVVLNGAPNIGVEAHFERQDGEPVGLQTMSFLGAFSYQLVGTDRGETCEVDLQITYDPETRTRTVAGSFCGREIDRSTTWSG